MEEFYRGGLAAKTSTVDFFFSLLFTLALVDGKRGGIGQKVKLFKNKIQ